jgi:hypothetical protein
MTGNNNVNSTVLPELFIIPNSLLVVTPFDGEHAWSKTKKVYGEEINGQILIQIWCTGQESDNWQCHGYPEHTDDYFIGYVPINIFNEKNDGDIVSIDGYSFKLNQKDYRYSSFGSFKELTELLKNNFIKKNGDYVAGSEQSNWVHDHWQEILQKNNIS